MVEGEPVPLAVCDVEGVCVAGVVVGVAVADEDAVELTVAVLVVEAVDVPVDVIEAELVCELVCVLVGVWVEEGVFDDDGDARRFVYAQLVSVCVSTAPPVPAPAPIHAWHPVICVRIHKSFLHDTLKLKTAIDGRVNCYCVLKA